MTSHSTFNIKLSPRLQQINAMVTAEYEHIWDCCCDHGWLGFSLLSQAKTNNIHFVDIVPELITNVESKLQRFYNNVPASNDHIGSVQTASVHKAFSHTGTYNTTSWYTHCIDVAKLPLTKYQGKHLVIIAGVGGDLMINFIKAIYQQYSELTIDFLLCPVHHQYALRTTLIDLNFSLLDEVLVEDKQRFYELLLVSSNRDETNIRYKISAVGNKIWQTDSSEQQKIADNYLKKTLKHYQRIQQGKTSDVQNIIDAYQAIRPEVKIK